MLTASFISAYVVNGDIYKIAMKKFHKNKMKSAAEVHVGIMSVANIRVTITDSTLRAHLASMMFDPKHTKISMGTNVARCFDESYKPPAWQTDLEFAYLIWLTEHDDTKIHTRVGILAAQQYICFYLGWEMLNKIQTSSDHASKVVGMERIAINSKTTKKIATREEAGQYINNITMKNIEVCNESIGVMRYPSQEMFDTVLEKIVFRGYISRIENQIPFEAVPL
jgi:hypothetical protein